MRDDRERLRDVLEASSHGRPIAELAGLLKRDYSKQGQTLNLGDVMIAATALHNAVALLTDNTRDFPMKDLRLYPLPN